MQAPCVARAPAPLDDDAVSAKVLRFVELGVRDGDEVVDMLGVRLTGQRWGIGEVGDAAPEVFEDVDEYIAQFLAEGA